MSNDLGGLGWKHPDYKKIRRPGEDDDMKWWRQWLVEITYGLWSEKKTLMAEMGFPAKPVTQQEIFREVTRRVAMMKGEQIWFHKCHEHNWVERRVNECVTEEFGPKDENGNLKLVRTAGDNLYEPNPAIFQKEA